MCGDAPQCFSWQAFLPGPHDCRLETADGTVSLWRSAKLDRGAPLASLVVGITAGRRGGFALENLYDSLFLVLDDTG